MPTSKQKVDISPITESSPKITREKYNKKNGYLLRKSKNVENSTKIDTLCNEMEFWVKNSCPETFLYNILHRNFPRIVFAHRQTKSYQNFAIFDDF